MTIHTVRNVQLIFWFGGLFLGFFYIQKKRKEKKYRIFVPLTQTSHLACYSYSEFGFF